MLNKIKFWFTKKKVIKIARMMGLDADGDILNYKGKLYYVNCFAGIVREENNGGITNVVV